MYAPQTAQLAYGAANLGNLYRAMSEDQAAALLEAAWSAGIRHFDTAPHYGLGLSERRLGEFLKHKNRTEYSVSTKVGRLLVPSPETGDQLDTENDFFVPASMRRVWDASPSGVATSLAQSLERLNLDHVDTLFLHDPERFGLEESLERALPALAELRDEGVVRSVGVASMTTSALVAAAETGLIDCLMVAGRLTLLDDESVYSLLPVCRRNAVKITSAAVFNSGLLARPFPQLNSHFDYGQPPAEVLERLASIRRICESFDVDVPTAAVQFGYRFSEVDTIVIGAASASQLEETTRRAHEPVDPALWHELELAGLIRPYDAELTQTQSS